MRNPETLQSHCVGCQRLFSPAEVQVRVRLVVLPGWRVSRIKSLAAVFCCLLLVNRTVNAV